MAVTLYAVTSWRDPGFLNAEDVMSETKLTPGVGVKTDLQVKQNDITLDALRKSLSDYMQVTSVPSVNPAYDHLNESKAEEAAAVLSADREDQCVHTCPSSRVPQQCEPPGSGESEVKAESFGVLPQVPHNTEIASTPFEFQGDIVERRYCTMCRMEQPLRAKHCKSCDRCVALHDHHCPWLGVCIGEKNRFFFYWLVVFQSLELWQAFYTVLNTQTCIHIRGYSSLWPWVEHNSLDVFLLCSEVFFGLLSTSLSFFHTYLALTGQTTCSPHAGEYISKSRISYLKSQPHARPFSRGWIQNLKLYCCDWTSRKRQNWLLPVQMPPGTKGNDQGCKEEVV